MSSVFNPGCVQTETCYLSPGPGGPRHSAGERVSQAGAGVSPGGFGRAARLIELEFGVVRRLSVKFE